MIVVAGQTGGPYWLIFFSKIEIFFLQNFIISASSTLRLFYVFRCANVRMFNASCLNKIKGTVLVVSRDAQLSGKYDSKLYPEKLCLIKDDQDQ